MPRSEEHTSELQSHRDLHSFPTRRSSDLLILRSGDVVAQLDDRDTAQALAGLEMGGQPVADDALLAWLDNGVEALTLRIGTQPLAVQRLPRARVAGHFGFVREPQPPPATPA